MIHLAPIDQLLIVVYLAAVVAIGVFAGRGRAHGNAVEFLLAGRSLTTPVFVMTLVSTWYGGILGVGEFSYRYGLSNWVIQGIPYYLFSAIFAFLLARRIRASNLITIPDKLEQAYGKPAALLGAFLTFLLMTPAPYVLMLAVLLQMVTGWSLLVCLLTGTAAATGYLVISGFRSDVQTDVFEFFLMFLGFAVILPYAYARFGGMEFLEASLPPLHLTWHGGNSMQFIAVWFLIALWTLVDPSFHQRCYAASSGRVARNGILISIGFWFIFDAMTAFAGLYARAALPSIEQPMMAYPLLAERVLPAGVKGLFYIGMLATIMSTLNTLTFVSGTTLGRDLLGRLWRGRRRGGLAATLHTGVETHGPPMDKDTQLTRWGLLVSALFSVVLALLVPSVIKLWYTIGTVLVPGLLVPLVTSYFDRLRVSGHYALSAMLAAWLTSLAWLGAGWTQELGATDRYPFGIEPMLPGLAVSLIVWGAGWMSRRCGERAS